MNPDLDRLQSYPFDKLRQLKAGIAPPDDKSAIVLSIGEPRHPTPAFIAEAIAANLNGLSTYPLTKGNPELRAAIAAWLTQRFAVKAGTLDSERHVCPVSGTREALFSFAQFLIDRTRRPLVLLPNPFYQIYEGAALLAGAEPYYLNTPADNDYLPDFASVPAAVWQRCQLLYVCSPGNPTGKVLGVDQFKQLIELAQRYDFVIASDECYSEIYFDEASPPPSLLQAASELGLDDFARCMVFHSLSKRSNVPGMRSGFVAGDARLIEKFTLYRTYHGCALPPYVQTASRLAWQDEAHVRDNRALYREKFAAVLKLLSPVLDVRMPEAGFFLWPRTPIDDADFARALFAQQNVTVLPGSYLSRTAHGVNPGANHVRIALVASTNECVDAAQRIRACLEQRN
jgi:N-succinyldiaminopimelate aminotransferase